MSAQPAQPAQLTVLRPGSSACDGCAYCCWALGGFQVPRQGPTGCVDKLRGCFCCWQVGGLSGEEPGACALHNLEEYPEACRDFYCAYRLLEDPATREYMRWPNGTAFPHRVHRPDVLQVVLMKLAPGGGIIPAVPVTIPVRQAVELIQATNTVMAAHSDASQQMPGGWNRGYVVRVTRLRDPVPERAHAAWADLVGGCWRGAYAVGLALPAVQALDLP